MGNQQPSSEQEKVQRLFHREVPTSVGKWGASLMDGDIVCAHMKV